MVYPGMAWYSKNNNRVADESANLMGELKKKTMTLPKLEIQGIRFHVNKQLPCIAN